MSRPAKSVVTAMRIAIIVALAAAWQLLCSNGVVSSDAVSSPSDIAHELWSWLHTSSFWRDVGSTLLTLALGYGAGVTLGVALGLLMGTSKIARAYAEPFVIFLNALPRLILVPFFVAWLGYGRTPQVLVVFLLIVFVVAVTVDTGVRGINPDTVRHAVMVGAGRLRVFSDVYLPAAGVWIVSSARLSVGFALQAAVVSEFFGSNVGLGYRINHGTQTFDPAEIYTAIIVTVVIAWMLDVLLTRVSSSALRWQDADR
jgi:ABC-type nitrate/sulfonate/bicarbonate transport system permease component